MGKSIACEAWEIDSSDNHVWYVPLFAHTGEVERARAILSNVNTDDPKDIAMAIAYDVLGEEASALQSLENTIERQRFDTGSPDVLLFIRAWPWVTLEGNPRFAELVRGLEETYTHTPMYATAGR